MPSPGDVEQRVHAGVVQVSRDHDRVREHAVAATRVEVDVSPGRRSAGAPRGGAV